MRGQGDSHSGRAELHLGPSFDAAWDHVILPWFKSVSLAGCSTDRPTLVVVPYQSRAQFFRHLLIEARLPLLGVEFVTPPQLRDLLLDSTGVKLPLREHLRLLLSIAAEEFIHSSAAGEPTASVMAARAVLREPDHLLRTIDELSAAGWAFREVGPEAFRQVVARFDSLVKQCGFTSIQAADRLAGKGPRGGKLIVEDLLIAGFDGAHWPFWPLLCATAKCAAHATILLTDPRDEARDLDECWVGSWEQIFGAARPIDPVTRKSAPPARKTDRPPAAGGPQLELFSGDQPSRVHFHFLVGQEITEQARAVVALVLKFLTEPTCRQVGVLFPAPGALARSVAALLNQLGLPHFDSIGHLIAPTLEDVGWLAWLDLQDDNRLKPLLSFISALDDTAGLLGPIAVARVEDVLRRAYSQILIDDIGVLRAFCARHSELRDAAAVGAATGAIKFLPLQASLPRFIAQTVRIFEQLGWNERKSELERLTRDWIEPIEQPVSRATYLRWLGEILGKPTRARDPMGDHPYSRVQLLSFAGAEGQSWSHLILAGLNEGAWPPTNDESDFVRDEEVDALNRRIKTLNRAATIPGRQGEGQWSVAEGKTLCLGASERRQLALRQMANLMESADTAIALTAALFTESVPRRLANPSEFFTRLYFNLHGSTLSQAALEALQAQTCQWVEQMALPDEPARDLTSVRATRFAYDARRALKPAGEFEFALRTPPAEPISLSASDFERFFKFPALIWMKSFLGVENDDQDMEQWSLAMGSWVHQWLRHIVPSGSPESFARLGHDLPTRVQEAAIAFRGQIATLLGELGHAVPDWWISTWNHASYVANLFATEVAQLEGWPYAATEWSLRGLPSIHVSDHADLKLRGRMDLVLARGAAKLDDLGGADLWVVDYKTGQRKSLRSSQWRSEEDVRKGVLKQLLKGEGIQIALYALALRQLGGGQIAMSLLARGLDLSKPQLQISEVIAHEPIWRELARIQKSGVFGMRGPIRSDFSFSGDYPLATLALDPDLLETKWALTHPALASDAEEEDG